MKKLIASLLLIVMAVSLFAGCKKAPQPQGNPQVMAALNGKKVLFVGSSATYYGGCVTPIDTDETNFSNDFSKRVNDNGFFYQLCRANGAEVNVVDWTFGGHGVTALLGTEPCAVRPPCEGTTPNGHLAYLEDRFYDYVIIEASYHGSAIEDSVENFKKYIKIFRDENPDVKIFYAVPHIVYARNWPNWRIKLLSALEKELDVTILDWGTMVEDIINGKVQVPGAKESYNKSSFVISKDFEDGYHQNILAGYLTALMAFSAITGVDAVGQPYDFCYSKDNANYPVSTRFLTEYYKESYYRYDNKETPDVNERKTNFIEIFQSESDMKGLQSLVNTYLADETNAWEKYITE